MAVEQGMELFGQTIPENFFSLSQSASARDNSVDARMRREYHQYLLSVFGSANVIMRVDHAIEAYNKTFQMLRSRATLSRPFLQIPRSNRVSNQREISAVVDSFYSCWTILDALSVHHRLLARSLRRDERVMGSIFEPLVRLWRGAVYSRRARHVCNRLEKNITEHTQVLSSWVHKFINTADAIGIKDFYKMHVILLSTQNIAWQLKIQENAYRFEEVSFSESIWLGATVRRELFFRVIWLDRRLQRDLDACSLENSALSCDKDFARIHGLAVALSAELEWCNAQYLSLSSLWQRSTKKLVRQRIAACKDRLQQLSVKKVRWFFYFAHNSNISSEQFAFLSASVPEAIAKSMRDMQKIFQKNTYYSRTNELALLENMRSLQEHAVISSASAHMNNVVQHYREHAIYYTRKDIVVFLVQDHHWTPQLEKQSKVKLDDMLNVSRSDPKILVASYLQFYADLVRDAFVSGVSYLNALQRISRMLKEYSGLLSIADKKNLDIFDGFMRQLKKLPQTEAHFLQHLANILQMSGDAVQLFRLANKFYRGAAPIWGSVQFNHEENENLKTQKKLLSNVIYKRMSLLPEKQKQLLVSMTMVQDMMRENPSLMNLNRMPVVSSQSRFSSRNHSGKEVENECRI